MANDAEHRSILIVGASRGLGKGLAETYARDGWSVLGTVRDPKDADIPGVETAIVDVNDPATVDALHVQTAGRKFDVIFLVAGIAMKSMAAIHEMEMDFILKLFVTNAVSPLFFAEKFLDRLAPGGHMVFMTSGVASITDLIIGGGDGYRASKVALNMLVKSFYRRHEKGSFTTTLMHPGWVKTELGGKDATVEVADSVAGMMKIIEDRTGKDDLVYVEYTGRIVPW